MRADAATLGSANARDNGFDTVRLLAATAVLVSHAFALTGYREPFEGIARSMSLGQIAVAVFFVTSGLLITMSADRRTTAEFGVQRAKRIMPALVVCVLVCMALGLAVTSLTGSGYLTARATWLFAGNVAFLPVGYGLPGVFADHANPAVNGSLWTLKFEIACYAVSFAFARWGRLRVPLLMAGWLASIVLSHSLADGETGVMFYVERFAFLFRFYGAGMLLYAFRERVQLRTDWALAALVVVCLSPLLGAFAEVAATLGAYALVVAAYRAPPWFRGITRKGDISYGVYLYAFPIQQLLVPVSLATALPWLTNMVLALPLTLFAGTLSWLVVERRFMRRPIDQTAAAHAF